MRPDYRTRFAPSPTGPLHLGHAYSAMLAHDMARRESGEFLLRIEDIDQSRSRPEWEAQICDDLAWLGLRWPKPILRQAEQMNIYAQALDRLWQSELLFSCTCTRRDIGQALAAPQEGLTAATGPDGPVYPGTCRDQRMTGLPRPLTERPQTAVLRLNMALAAGWRNSCGPNGVHFHFTETGTGPNGETGLVCFTADEIIETVGDIVLARRDMGTSYHLSVVLDDAAQGITQVVRGQDLFEATKIHVLLQHCLGLPTPSYHHHRLIRDAAGKRLAKRDDARALSRYRAEGATPNDIRRMVGLSG